MRRGFIIGSLLLCTAAASTAAQTYDPKTGIAELPGSPLSPTSYAQCDSLQQQWSRLNQALDDAHQKCLDAHRKEPEDPRASFAPGNPVCSHSPCQSLHTARLEMQRKAEDRVRTCRADVAQWQKNQHLEEQREQEQQAAIQQTVEQEKQQVAEREKWQAQQLEQQRREANQKIAAILAANAKVLEQNLRLIQQMEAAADTSSSSTGPSSLPPMTSGESQMLQGLMNGADANGQSGDSSAPASPAQQTGGNNNSTDQTSDSPTGPAVGLCGVDFGKDPKDSSPTTPPSGPPKMFVAFAFSTLGLRGSGGDGACGVGISRNEQKAIDQSGVGCAVVSQVPDWCGRGNGGHYQVCQADGKTRWIAIAVSNDGHSLDWSDGEAIGALTREQAVRSAIANCGRSGCQLKWVGSASCRN